MTIQYPERGQPLDIDYLYQMARSINNLNDKLSSSKTLSNIYYDNVQNSLTTNQIRFYSTKKNVVIGSVTAGKIEEITVNFDGGQFTKIPIVMASIQNNTTSSVGSSAIITVRSVVNTGAIFNINFTKQGAVDIVVNVLAIGI